MSCDTWFGTHERMMWIPTPLSGAGVDLEGWTSGGNLLNGGGYQFNSWDANRSYTFEWRGTSSYQMAQLVNSYSQGSFGRGLIYFIPPTIYDKNILPPRWADPGMTVGGEGVSLVPGIEPSSVPASGGEKNLLPVNSAQYTFTRQHSPQSSIQYLRQSSVFIPIPEGFTLLFGAIFSASGNAGVRVFRMTKQDQIAQSIDATPVSPESDNLAPMAIAGSAGVRVSFFGAEGSTLTVNALTARLIPTKVVETGGTLPLDRVRSGPWVGGLGNAGCRFVGKPTMVLNNGRNGGQAGFAATLREVGSWMNG